MMQVFKIILAYEKESSTRFFFNEERSAQAFFLWLCNTYGPDTRWDIQFQSDANTSKEPVMTDEESARREMVWDFWHANCTKETQSDEPRVYH